MKLKSQRVEASELPGIGDVIQIKENILRGSWKIGKIVKLISNKERHTKAATIILPTRCTINRPLNMIHPLECGNEKNDSHEDLKIKETDEPKGGNSIKLKQTEQEKSKDESVDENEKRHSNRRTAMGKRERILDQT